LSGVSRRPYSKGMTHTTHARCKLLLEAKAAELRQSLGDRRIIAIEHAPEETEQTVLSAAREFAVGQLDRDSRLLREVRAALNRIDEGEYGICETCEGEIKPKRLEAAPWTRRCLACQARMEEGETRVGSASDFTFAA